MSFFTLSAALVCFPLIWPSIFKRTLVFPLAAEIRSSQKVIHSASDFSESFFLGGGAPLEAGASALGGATAFGMAHSGSRGGSQ